jgi:hypothetical protein
MFWQRKGTSDLASKIRRAATASPTMKETLMPVHASLGEALLAVQAEAKAVQANAINEGFKRNNKPSRYVPLETLMPAILPLLNKHGLVWTTMPAILDNGQPALRYCLTRSEQPQPRGINTITQHESIYDAMPLLGVSNMQQLGAAITYARRQSLMAVLGLVAEKDDDGTTASAGPKKLGAADRRKFIAELEAVEQAENAQVAGLILSAAGVSTKSSEWLAEDGPKIRVALDEHKGRQA